MKFYIRPFDVEKDYLVMQRWFSSRNFPAPEKEYLPKIGGVIEHEHQAVAIGFVFRTDTPIAIISHLVSDPAYSKEIRRDAVDELVRGLFVVAKEWGYTAVSCATNIPKLGERFEKIGFIKTDENVSHYRSDVCQ
jgi:hypothetical protein